MNTNGLETDRAAKPRVSCCHITQASGEKAVWTLSQGCLPGWVRTGPRGLGHLEDQEQYVRGENTREPPRCVCPHWGGDPDSAGGRPGRRGAEDAG